MMDPISNVDRLVLILRQRLQERAATASARTTAGSARERPARGMDAVQALAGLEGVDDRQLKRALMQSLLVEHFGSSMVNDARFQQVVSQVTEAVEDTPVTARLMEEVVGAMRMEARQ